MNFHRKGYTSLNRFRTECVGRCNYCIFKWGLILKQSIKWVTEKGIKDVYGDGWRGIMPNVSQNHSTSVNVNNYTSWLTVCMWPKMAQKAD